MSQCRIEETSVPAAPSEAALHISFWSDAFRRLCKNRPALAGLSLLTLLTCGAIFCPIASSHTYYTTHLAFKNTPPCAAAWFGTDELGRDLFTRIWWGARISLTVGISAALIDMAIGAIYGAFAAMKGGRVDEWMMRSADILHSLPYLLMVILLMVTLPQGILTIILAITITGWINMARIVRGQILQIKQNDFVLAAYTLGATPLRILIRHLVPNAMGVMIATLTMTISTAIFTEAFLSFLGLGVQAPIASWGTLASDGLAALRYYPWRIFFPAGFLSITMLSLNLVGDGIRDAFDPRLRT